MVLITLPTPDQPNANKEARAKLAAAISDALTVVMIVQGNDADARAAVEMCVARASTKPNIRRVVWVPEKSVLTQQQQDDYTPQGAGALSIGLDDNPAATLTPVQAKLRAFVEDAFLKAEKQGVSP